MQNGKIERKKMIMMNRKDELNDNEVMCSCNMIIYQ